MDDKAIFNAKLAAVRKHTQNAIANKSGANSSVVDDAMNALTPIDVPTPRVYLTEKEREETVTREYEELIIQVRKLPKLVGYKVVDAALRKRIFSYMDWIKYVGYLAIKNLYLMPMAYEYYCILRGTTVKEADAGWWYESTLATNPDNDNGWWKQFVLSTTKVEDEPWWDMLALGAKGPNNMFGASQSGSVVNAVFDNAARKKARQLRIK